MTRPGAVVIVSVVALAFAGLASWGVYSYLQKETLKSKSAQGENIVVAAVDIPIGAKLSATQIKTAQWPRESLPPGSLTDLKSVEGRVCIRPLQPNEPITEQKLVPKEGTPGAGVMTYRVPQGHRAVTVAVNEVAGVAGFLAPENRVDVVVTTPIPGNASGESISKIVLQNIPILATGQITDQKDGKPVVVPTVTLDLSPEDAEKLILAGSKGSLQLLLRNLVDTATVESKGATIVKVLGGIERPAAQAVVKKKAPAPVKSRSVQVKHTPPTPPPAYNVEVIKGRDRTIIKFSPSDK
ncbi:MAG: Flp pilus assembly protein CpaB [Geobacteraceae bacterium]